MGYRTGYREDLRGRVLTEVDLIPESDADPVVASSASTAHVSMRGLGKRFGSNIVYDNFDVTFPRGKVTSIFGPNGCGKSTLLAMAAGIIPADRGQILYDGRTVDQVTTGFVFQNYREALFPWKRAIDNITYPLRVAGMKRAARRERVEELVAQFDIRFDLHRYPYELSGGQQQLASVLRALAVHPEVLFLDEPFSALDFEMTIMLRDKLQEIVQATRLTTLVVSHDIEEAVYLADEIVLLTKPPTAIAETVAFPSPRPRHVGTLAEPGFVATKARCMETFQREVRR